MGENPERIEELEDAPISLIHTSKLKILLEKSEAFDKIQEGFSFSPELRRDHKIVMAYLEYQKESKNGIDVF